jgi:cysteinyl-tRNA synthetase
LELALTLRLYNTLTRRKEAFAPADPNHVRMYVCGPTVYDLAHVGNARPVVVFDVLYRLLKRLYPRVTYARNVTDIDDKIIAAAKENDEDIGSLTQRTERAFHDDMAALGALAPDIEPHATAHIPQMIALVETLIANGNAYVADGHVLFEVATMRDYGRLSRHSRDELVAGARVEVAPYKRYPADFVLWKPSSPDQPGWESPWGRGRPGWHLECSAMSEAHLGLPIDIHGGGQDLIFPHHENEIAQSVCAHKGAEFVRTWMHNGHVMVEGEKMSKSLGNFYTVRQLLEEGWDGEVIRLALLKTHYRAPLNFTRDALAEAKAELDGLYNALRGASGGANEPVVEALADDLNTPLALATLHRAPGREAAELLGLLQRDPEAWFKAGIDDAAEIERLIARRNVARKTKDFAEADRIRDQLKSRGIILTDMATGSTDWRRA